MKTLNQAIGTIQMALIRLVSAWGQHLAIVLGVMVATTVICATVLYAEGVSAAMLRDRLGESHNKAVYDFLVKGTRNVIDRTVYEEMSDFILNRAPVTVGLPVTRVGRHGWSKPLRIIPPGQSPEGQRYNLPRTRFQFYAGIEDQVEVITGEYPQVARDPQDTIEVMITDKLAEKLELRVGDQLTVEDYVGGRLPKQATVRVAAIIRLRDPESNFWFYAPWYLDEAFTVPEETFFNAISLAFVPVEGDFTWVANFDESQIGPENVGRVIAGIHQFRFELGDRLSDVQFLTDLDKLLAEYQRNDFFLTAMLIVLGAPVIGIALYYIIMSSAMIVEAQRGEIALLKSRGAGNWQVSGLFLAQGLVLSGAAMFLGPFAGLPLAQLIGRATTFLSFTHPRALPVHLRPAIFGYALAAGVLALMGMLWPALKASRETIVTYRREAARPRGAPIFHRYYVDVALLILAGLGYRILTQRGTIVTRGPTGGLEFDPLLLVTPIILVMGAALFALRLMPLLTRGLAWLANLGEGVSILIGLRQIARQPGYYFSLVLLLTFTLSLGLFTASVAGTFDRNYGDQALYQAGADLRVQEFDFENMVWRILPLEEYRALPGVVDAMAARRVELVGRAGEIRARGVLLGIDPERFPSIAWYREDFAPQPLEALMASLAGREDALLAHRRFVQRHRLAVGQTFDINIEGPRVDFTLVGTFDYFPTLFPDDGDLLVCNLDYLLDMVGGPPSEAWLRLKPDVAVRRNVIAALTAERGELVRITDGHELTGIRSDDPLRTGLFGALSVGFIAATVLSIIGFLLYTYMTVQRRALQFGVLRADGLSVGQLVGVLATEQLFLVGLGIGLGTALGAGTGWTFTRFLQLSIIARNAIPPFLVVTPWPTIFRLYLILVIIFAAALAMSVWLLRRMRVHAVLRLGEQ